MNNLADKHAGKTFETNVFNIINVFDKEEDGEVSYFIKRENVDELLNVLNETYHELDKETSSEFYFERNELYQSFEGVLHDLMLSKYKDRNVEEVYTHIMSNKNILIEVRFV